MIRRRRGVLQSGSFLWLLAHDLRLAWRGFADVLGRLGERGAPLVVVLAVALVHLVAWPLAAFVGAMLDGAATRGQGAALVAAALTSGLMWTTSQALVAATRALFVRADLELLLTAPVPPSRVLAARAVAIALSSAGSVALMVLPIAHMGAVLGRPGWLLAWPALVILGLVGTALGLVLAIAIFLVAGRHKARLVANLVATAIAGAFVLGVQIWLMLPADLQETIQVAAAAGSLSSLEAQAGVLRLLSGAARGDVSAVLAVTLFAGGLFAFSVWLLAGRFARAVMEAAGASTAARRRETPRDGLAFGTGALASLRRKEWRLMLRDPSLFSQLALQMIYTVPIAVVLARNSEHLPSGFAVAPAITVIAAQLAASLAWLTVSGEDAPELIATAPVSRARIEWAKLAAIALPLAMVLAGPIVWLAVVAPHAGLVTLAAVILAALSTAFLNLWHPMPGNRRGLLRRHAQSKLIGLVEHALSMLWAVAVVLALFGSWLVIVPVLLVAAILVGAAPQAVQLRRLLHHIAALRTISPRGAVRRPAA
jgi:ABC-2 type transport system permease protein